MLWGGTRAPSVRRLFGEELEGFSLRVREEEGTGISDSEEEEGGQALPPRCTFPLFGGCEDVFPFLFDSFLCQAGLWGEGALGYPTSWPGVGRGYLENPVAAPRGGSGFAAAMALRDPCNGLQIKESKQNGPTGESADRRTGGQANVPKSEPEDRRAGRRADEQSGERAS